MESRQLLSVAAAALSPAPIQSVAVVKPAVTNVYASVSGLVTDSAGSPISGATVYVVPAAGAANTSASATTNSRGQYTLSAVPIGSVVLHAYAKNYLPSSTTSFSVAAGDNTAPTIKLPLGAVISGLVTDAGGTPISGASISIVPASPAGAAAVFTATTSSIGQYTSIALAPGSYLVQAHDTGYVSSASVAFSAAAGTDSAPTVKLTKIIYGAVSGLITDSNGSPIANASVIILASSSNSTSPAAPEVHTNASGDYTFASVPVGTYIVRAYATGYFAESTAAFTVVLGSNTAPTLKLVQAAVVSGLITDSNGVALAGASVSLVPSTTAGGQTTYSTTASSAGTYSFTAVVPGTYVVHASETGYVNNASAAFTAAAGANTAPTVKLTKIIYGSVGGLITDSSGTPIANASVIIVPTTANANMASVPEVHTDASGDYTFPSVPVGSYVVRAYATGYLSESTAAFTVVQGSNAAPTLKLPAAGIVSGLVTTVGNVGISGATVSLVSAASPTSAAVATATTNSTGGYTFSSVPVGTYVLHVSATGYFPNSSASFTVSAGTDSAPAVQLKAAPLIVATGPGSATSPGPILTTLTPTFTWNAASGVTGYQINLYDITNQKFYTFIINSPTQTSLTLSTGVLTAGQDYVWNIRALSGSVSGPENGYYYFQT